MRIKRQAAEGPQASAFAANSRSFYFSPSADGDARRLTTAPTGGEVSHV